MNYASCYDGLRILAFLLCILLSLYFRIDNCSYLSWSCLPVCLVFVASFSPVWGMGTWQSGIRAQGCNSGPLWAMKDAVTEGRIRLLCSAEQQQNSRIFLSVDNRVIERISGFPSTVAEELVVWHFTIADGEATPHPTWNSSDRRRQKWHISKAEIVDLRKKIRFGLPPLRKPKAFAFRCGGRFSSF